MGIFDNLFSKKEIDLKKISSSVLGTIAVAESMVLMHETLKNVKIKRDFRYDQILILYMEGVIDLYNTAFGVKKILEGEVLIKHHEDMEKFCIIQHHLQKLQDQDKKVSEFETEELEKIKKENEKEIDRKLNFIKVNSFNGYRKPISDRGYEYAKYFYQNNGEIIGTKFAFDLAKILEQEEIQFDK